MDGEELAEVPQAQYVDRVMDVPNVCRRQEQSITTAQKTVEVPQIQSLDRVHEQVVDVPAVMPHKLP